MEAKTGIPLIDRAVSYDQRMAIVDESGAYTYRQLLSASKQAASLLLQDRKDLEEQRVAFMVPPGFTYAAVKWGIWTAGGIAVPLCVSYPPPELEYVIYDSDAEIVVAHPEYAAMLRPISDRKKCRFLLTSQFACRSKTLLPSIDLYRRAMILYTSGTTGKPKGVVTTHSNITAQITSLVKAWEWTAEDRILGVLPLHHVHGIINILSCALWSGATCELLAKFDASAVWERFVQNDYTLFMAVPTVYVRLISAWEEASEREKEAMSRACSKFRLMVSGSAALPVSVFEKWKAITGQVFLERYGMTEIGMGLSNPVHGERRPGYVGVPLPGVRLRLVDEKRKEIHQEGVPGEIQVQGQNVFLEYWRRPEETKRAFHNGWFNTGDIAVVENGYYRILGRNSVDIIKTGGYKVSALEIEEVLRTHKKIRECAVVGVEDPQWGERVCAAVVLRAPASLTLKDLRSWAKKQIAPYKVPSRLLILEELPRNAMGKVTKPAVKKLFGRHLQK
ncbi:MAG: acyl-CoA synthetase [Deltaproteobacteria bacterium]|nr:acyl-CoA synthetase [Deltaproteobacteria bacterium]